MLSLFGIPSVGKVSPQVGPTHSEARKRGLLACRSHRVATIVASAKTARGVQKCGTLCTRPRTTTTTTTIAGTSASRRATLDTADTRSVLARDKVPVVSINSIVGYTVVGEAAAAVLHVSLGRLVGLLRAVKGGGRCCRHCTSRPNWPLRGQLSGHDLWHCYWPPMTSRTWA